jgi:glycosyltransferase involved in cell wall biosynthesis
MKIGINCRILNKRHGGPKRFSLNLIKALIKIDKKNTYYLILDKDFEFPFKLPKKFKKIKLKTKSILIFEYLNLPLFTYKEKIDYLILPNLTFAPYLKSKKLPVFHDIIYFEKDQKREFRFFDNLHNKIMISICKKLSSSNLCVSEFTESRVKDILGLKKTEVIGEGVEDSFKPITNKKKLNKIIKKYNLKVPFIFYIGSLSPRKNIKRLIFAFDSIKNEIPHNLYLFGGYSWLDKDIKELLNQEKYKDRVFKKGFIEEEDLPALYSLSTCFIYPSLYEGFGLPILEAQACGCPVISSNTTSIPEVGGNSIYFINPYNEDEIAKAILNITKDKKLREELIKKGYKNIKRFSWEKTARKVLNACKKIEKNDL